MQPLLDIAPVVAFFVAYWLSDFQTATLVIMIAITVQVIATRLITGSVSKVLVISAGLVVVMGGISLLLKNDLIFMWKPTVLNWLFAVICLGSQYFGEKTIIQRLIEATSKTDIRLSQSSWSRLNLMWFAFFLVSGAANIFVALNFSESVWVNFKLFGLLGMTFVFIMLQAVWLSRNVMPDPKDSTTNSQG